MKTIFFDSEIAARYGVDEAIMIQNFAYWIEKNEANGRHFYDGRTWTYNSADAFAKLLPFWNSRQIRRILKSLEEKEVIMTGNYNASAFVRTTWYAFTDSFYKKCNLDVQKSVNGEAENGRCNDIDIYNNPSIYPNNNPNNNAAEGSELFPSEPKVKKPRGTSEPLCLFSNSRYNDFEKFAAEFQSPEFAGIDIAYYYHAVADWSSSKSKKRADWIATARNFMRGDMQTGKVRRVQAADLYAGLDPDTIEYLKDMSEGL